jgi:pyruvate/2-oxoglutarate dehydrogenase complex dihydrolipoamide acyltransferase (E2) component
MACAACLAAGAWLGWRFRGEPPKPSVKIEWREREDKSAKNESKAAVATAASSLALTPASQAKTKRKTYYPPTVSCAPADKPCVCPGPGPLASEEETDTKKGEGVVATNATSKGTSESHAETSSKRQHEGLQDESYADPPRLTLGLGAAASPFAEAMRPAPALALTLRVNEYVTLQAAVESQLSDLKQLRMIALVGIPIW